MLNRTSFRCYCFHVFTRIGIACAAVLFTTLASAQQAQEGAGRVPKNVILMISDGCGYNHVIATDLYEHGETGRQIYEQFPFRAAMSTYPLKGGVPVGYDPVAAWSDPKYPTRAFTDSAASGTALSTGHKTYNGAIGMDSDRKPLVHAWERAERRGMATGVVTSVQFSHATPAAFVAHNKSRSNYAEIAREMIMDSAVDVIIGCGHPCFDRDGNELDEPKNFNYVGGEDVWQALVDGTAGADADGDEKPDPWTLVQTRKAFQALSTGETPKRLCGVAQVEKTLQQRRSGDGNAVPFAVPLLKTMPNLAELSRAALNVLDEDPDGFYLMIEGGAVDWASHDNQSGRMVEEQIDFNRAVEAVVEWVETHSSWDETLVMVTADHECGYLTAPTDRSKQSAGRASPDTLAPLPDNGAGQLPGMQWNSDNHTNLLVPIYAKGAGIERLSVLSDQTDPKRGDYLDNAEIGQLLHELIDAAEE
jgi:alkaline phosphatase